MSALAHHSITVSVTGAVDTCWVISSHYCDDGPIGERSVRKRVREEQGARGVTGTMLILRAHFVRGIGWEVDVHITPKEPA